MKGIGTVGVAAVAICFLARTTWALPPTDSVAYDMGQPSSPAAGKVLGSGSLTVAPAETFVSVKMIVYVAGKQGQEVTCMVDQNAKTWSAMAAGLPTGTYPVVMRMITTGGNGNDTFSTTASVDVK